MGIAKRKEIFRVCCETEDNQMVLAVDNSTDVMQRIELGTNKEISSIWDG